MGLRLRRGAEMSKSAVDFRRLRIGKAAGVDAHDQQSDEDGTDQHHHADVQTGVKSLIAKCGSEQAGGCADRAQTEVELFDPTARENKQPEQDGRDDEEDAAENPGSGCNGRWQPDSGGGGGGDHLPESNQEKDDGVNQSDEGALAVGKNGKFAHGAGYIEVHLSGAKAHLDVICVTMAKWRLRAVKVVESERRLLKSED